MLSLAKLERGGDLTVWDFQESSATVKYTLPENITPVACLSLSPDDRFLVSEGLNETVCLREFATGKLVTLLRGQKGHVGSVAWSGDGKYIVTGSSDKKVRLWEVHEQVSVCTCCVYACF